MPSTTTPPPSLEAAAARLGHYAWLERRMFEALGGWAAAAPEPAVRVLCDRHARQRAWHASLWQDRLPVLADVDRASLIAAPNGAWSDGLTFLAAPESARFLAGAYRVVGTHQRDTYRAHLASASPVSEGPTIRALELVLADQDRQASEGESLIGLLCRQDAASSGDLERHQQDVDQAWRSLGGLAG